MKVKHKTKKILTKRFKVTKNGKVMRRQAFTGHLNVKKSKKKKRNLGKTIEMKKALAKRVKKALGK